MPDTRRSHSIHGISGESELRAIVLGVGASPNLFDALDRDWYVWIGRLEGCGEAGKRTQPIFPRIVEDLAFVRIDAKYDFLL